MEIRIAKLKAEDLEVLRAETPLFSKILESDDAKRLLEQMKFSYTVSDDEGILFCGGVVEYWSERGEGWVAFSDRGRKHFFRSIRILRMFLNTPPIRRIEASVRVGHEKGKKLVEHLGFVSEGFCKSFLPDGGDAILYARVA